MQTDDEATKIKNYNGLIPNIPRANGVNANNYITSGIWYFTDNCQNVPIGYFFLIVLMGNTPYGLGDVLQLAVQMGEYKLYRRHYSFNNSNWTAWKSLTFS